MAQLLASAREDLIDRRDHGRLIIRYHDAYKDVTLDPVFVEACKPIVNRILDQRIAAIDHDLQALGVEIA